MNFYNKTKNILDKSKNRLYKPVLKILIYSIFINIIYTPLYLILLYSKKGDILLIIFGIIFYFIVMGILILISLLIEKYIHSKGFVIKETGAPIFSKIRDPWKLIPKEKKNRNSIFSNLLLFLWVILLIPHYFALIVLTFYPILEIIKLINI